MNDPLCTSRHRVQQQKLEYFRSGLGDSVLRLFIPTAIGLHDENTATNAMHFIVRVSLPWLRI